MGERLFSGPFVIRTFEKPQRLHREKNRASATISHAFSVPLLLGGLFFKALHSGFLRSPGVHGKFTTEISRISDPQALLGLNIGPEWTMFFLGSDKEPAPAETSRTVPGQKAVPGPRKFHHGLSRVNPPESPGRRPAPERFPAREGF